MPVWLAIVAWASKVKSWLIAAGGAALVFGGMLVAIVTYRARAARERRRADRATAVAHTEQALGLSAAEHAQAIRAADERRAADDLTIDRARALAADADRERRDRLASEGFDVLLSGYARNMGADVAKRKAAQSSDLEEGGE